MNLPPLQEKKSNQETNARENLQEAKDLLPQPVVSWQVGGHAGLASDVRETDIEHGWAWELDRTS